jgi:hypothetical protein
VEALRVILRHPQALPWQKEQATFVIGLLHAGNSLEPLRVVVVDPTSQDAVLHAALWAIGDICGTGRPSVHDDIELFERVIRIANEASTEELRWASTYALAMGRHPYVQNVLAKLRDTRFDRVTRALAVWGQEVYRAELVRHRPRCAPGNCEHRTIPREPEDRRQALVAGAPKLRG